MQNPVLGFGFRMLISRGARNFDLCDNNHLAGRHIEGEIYPPMSALSNELAANPSEGGYKKRKYEGKCMASSAATSMG